MASRPPDRVEISEVATYMEKLQRMSDIRRELVDRVRVEIEAGRQPREKYGPRELDIDIVLYGEEEISTDTLEIPHPALTERLFVLIPLAELAPGLTIPGRGPVEEILATAVESLPAEEVPQLVERREGPR